MVKIYDFNNVSEYLKWAWHEKRNKNPKYSITSWAKQMGLNSHGPLQQMLAGQRGVPKRLVPKLIHSLKLTGKESEFFETLVDLSRSKDTEERRHYLDRLKRISPRREKIKFSTIESMQYFENPLHAHIRTLIDRIDFKNSSSWIQQQLITKVTIKEIKEAMERLKTLGLIEEIGGRLLNTTSYSSSLSDVPSESVKEYHRKILRMSVEPLDKQSVTEREYNSFSFNIKEGKVPEAKKRLRDFISDFLQEFESPVLESNQTYNLNMQFFSLTKKGVSK